VYSDRVSNEHISDTLRDMNALTPHMHQNSDFAELFAAGRRRICSDEKERDATKEVVGICVLLTRSLFESDILRRLLRRVSLAKPTSAPLQF
jgi:hypothetical protein